MPDTSQKIMDNSNMSSPTLTLRPLFQRALAIAVIGVLGGTASVALTSAGSAHAAENRPTVSIADPQPDPIIGDADTPSIGGTAPDTDVIGSTYSFTPTTAHGPDVVFAVASGRLPGGLALDPTTGVISGYAAEPGRFPFNISVTDSGGTAEAPFTINVPITGGIQGTPPDAVVGQPYTFTPTTPDFIPGPGKNFGGLPLPDGLTRDPLTGTISGVPTTANPAAVLSITAISRTGIAVATRRFTIKIAAAVPTISGVAPDGVIGQPYSFTPTSTHGPDAVFVLNTGTLPAGLTLNPTTGAITGVPTTPGATNFTLSVTDRGGLNAGAFTITITAPAPAAIPTIGGTAPDGVVGKSYAFTPTSTHGPGAVFVLNTGTLPAGLTPNPTTGAITGKPTTPGTNTFTLAITDQGGLNGEAFTIKITAPVPAVIPVIGGTAPGAITGPPLTPTTPAPSTPKASAENTSTLASTGAETGITIALGALTLLTGALLLTLNRLRNRTKTQP